jgi:hypothetical protein
MAGVGLTPLEAILFGTPVIVTSVVKSFDKRIVGAS